MRIAFAGNPNSGKTTMFNALTGSKAKVANWGGVTVGQRGAHIKPEYVGDAEVIAVDLPGAYSMSPFSPEESITSEYVRESNPDAIINIVDATNLGRSLFFTTQLLELGVPMVVALNKSDLNEKEAIQIDAEKLAARLGCPVVPTAASQRSDNGLTALVKQAIAVATPALAGAEGTTDAGSSAVTATKPPFQQESIDLTDKAAVDAQDRRRFAFVNEVVASVETRQVAAAEHTADDKIDAVLTNPFVGIPVFAAVMWAVFTVSQVYLGPLIADWIVGWIETFQEWVSNQMADSPAILTTVVADGVIGGVGAVIGFLPLVMVMYFLLALLEQSGYMARVSAVLDPIFKRVGLSGKSVIPIVIGTGCAIPAIMSTRTIRDARERRATAMLTPFIPCGAKIPVIALFAGAFFNGSGWVSWLSYFVGLALIFFSALMVKSVTGYKYRKSFFIMELPRYSMPNAWQACLSMLERAKAYIIKAATIILVCNLVVQVMQSFNWQFQIVPEGMEDTSILASIATPISFLLIPLGFGAWQLAAAAVTGFIAKENVVGTLAVVYGLTAFIDTEELAMTGGANQIAVTMGLTSVSALAYLFFNLFTPPCFAAIGAMRSEMQHKGWLASAIALQFCTGFTVAFLVNQVGTLIVTGHFAAGFVPGLIAVIAMVTAIVLIGRKLRAGFAEKYSLRAASTELAA